MAERLLPAVRPIGMSPRAIGSVPLGLLLSMLLVGCGDQGDPGTEEGGPGASTTSASGTYSCVQSLDAEPVSVEADLDGDGETEKVSYRPDCPNQALLTAHVADTEVRAPLEDDLPVSAGDLSVVRMPSRPGDVVLVTAQHPRGGFQAHLFGYADGTLEELTVAGRPLFPFVATDTLSSPLAATCTGDGFEVTEARQHQPIGVVPAWDVHRTTYTVAGNSVTKGTTTEVADNVLDKQLHAEYGNLVDHALFENCRTGS